MPKPPEVLEVVRQWLRKADHDLVNASAALVLEDLKAFLVSEGRSFPRHHDIGELIALLPAEFAVDLSPEEQERLTDYATVTRYPGDYDDIPLAEAREAVAAARRVRAAAGGMLGAGDP